MCVDESHAQKVIIKLCAPEITNATCVASLLALLILLIFYLFIYYMKSVKQACLIMSFAKFSFLAV